MLEIILRLIATASMGAGALVIYGGAGRWMVNFPPLARQMTAGAILGSASVLALFLPVTVAPGYLISSAQITVALAGLFGGWPGGIVGAAMAISGRLAVGGAGALPGALSLGLAAAPGVAIAEWLRYRNGTLGLRHLVLCSALVVVTSYLAFLFVTPQFQGELFRILGGPIAIAYPLGTLFLGWLLLHQRQSHDLARRLAESDARMRDVFDNLPGTIYQMRLDPDGTLSYIYASARVQDSHGVTGEQMVKNASLVDSTFLPEEEEDRWRYLRESMATMKPGQREFRMRRPNGEIRWLRTHSTPKRDAQGNVVWTGFTLDITAEREKDQRLRKSVEELAESARQLRGIVASVPGVVYQVSQSLEGGVTYRFVSDGVRSVFGVEPEAVLKDASLVLRTYLPEDEPERLRILRESAASLGMRERIFRIRRADGTSRWLHSRSVPHQSPNGEILWDGVTLDITAQKDLEEELRRSLAERAASEERMRAIIRSVPGAVYQIRYLAGGSSTYTFLSEGIRDLIGYSVEEIMADQSIIHAARLPEDEPERLRTAEESRAAISLRVREFRGRHRDGSIRWFHSRSLPHQEESGDVVWDGITMDITDRKQLEEELRRSEHMLALGGLVDGVAHNFNNLLQIISGGAELLLHVLAERPEDRAIADQILNATNRGAHLVNELRRFSNRQPSTAQWTDVNPLLADLRDLAGNFVGSKVTLDFTAAPDLWKVAVNPTRLQSVVLSLILNARDAMPNGGVIRVETLNVVLGEVEARGIDRPPGPYVSILVTDTGEGMSPEVLRRATEPFFTTKPANQAGLGLSNVHAFMNQMGGHFAISSELSAGTRVRLLFPAESGADSAAAPKSPAHTAPKHVT